EPGSIPVVAGGQKPAFYCNEYNRAGENVTISSSGCYAGFVMYWDGPIYVSDAFTAEPNEKALPKYLYYFLKSKQNIIHSRKRGGGTPHIYASDIAPIRIPLPPIKAQREIIYMLDSFCGLIEKLDVEIEARKKQFGYYCDTLVNSGVDTGHHELGEVCSHVDYRGRTPKKVSSGVFLITAKNIKKGYIDYETSKEYIRPEDYGIVMRRGHPKKGDVVITTEAPCGNVAQIDREGVALGQRVIKYRGGAQIIDNTFLKYALLSGGFQNKLLQSATGGQVKGVRASKLHKLKIPVPKLDEQVKIISCLEKFDSLANIILPYEARLRREQYVYYRDKLFSFMEGL
ncbi:MAG: restriction endonuclease subunit S, partial [Clostridiales bacterium]|nr:restriction endonuclease subunit S [Clostridiales bacterium]